MSDEPISATAAPALTADQLEQRIAQRRAEMETQPCYRCNHSNAKPENGCPCCANAHTPDADGNFKED